MGNRTLVAVTALLFVVMVSFLPTIGECADENVWYVIDIIEPTIDQVKWSEQGGIYEPISWIADGSRELCLATGKSCG